VTDSSKPKTLLVFRQPPYSSSLSRSGLDTALAAGAFEQPVTLLFLSDGIMQLLPKQNSASIGKRNHGKVLASLPLYDIETFWVDAEALSDSGYAINELPEGSMLADRALIRDMLAQHDHILTF
jgi:tRNA 2-thiouridine synthesizing protein C